MALIQWEFLDILQPSPTQYLDYEWVCPGYSIHALSRYLSHWKGADNLLHHQIKLRISTSMRDLRTRRDLRKFICTS